MELSSDDFSADASSACGRSEGVFVSDLLIPESDEVADDDGKLDSASGESCKATTLDFLFDDFVVDGAMTKDLPPGE